MAAEANAQTREERVLRGIGVTTGIAIAPIYAVSALRMGVRTAGSPGEESRALREAMARSARELASLAGELDEEAAEILEFQIVLLDDDEMLAPVFLAIDAGEAADAAWRTMMNAEIEAYGEGDDPVFAARAEDLADLRERVLASLTGKDGEKPGPSRPSIVMARDLAPSRLLEFDPACVAGIALGEGSRTSHVALLARARGIPMVAGLGDLTGCECATQAVLDAKNGSLSLQPSAATLDDARRQARQLERARRRADEFIGRTLHTSSGERINVCVNIDHVSMLDAVQARHCDGIGLARTEFLFDSAPPDEDSQLAVYARLIRWAEGRPVTIRTLDAGGDKPVPGVARPVESNPFLGLRGVRLSLAEPALLEVQLRALLRAAALGPLKIMVPMVTEPAELCAVAAVVNKAARDLRAQGIPFAEPAVGMMVEVPAAALCAADFDAAFYSIGSNDLIQYATATARDNPAVVALARSDHPGVTALIEAVVAAGRRLGREVSVCGDMASDPGDALRLVDLGVRTLSVAPAMLGPVKAALSVGGTGRG